MYLINQNAGTKGTRKNKAIVFFSFSFKWGTGVASQKYDASWHSFGNKQKYDEKANKKTKNKIYSKARNLPRGKIDLMLRKNIPLLFGSQGFLPCQLAN